MDKDNSAGGKPRPILGSSGGSEGSGDPAAPPATAPVTAPAAPKGFTLSANAPLFIPKIYQQTPRQSAGSAEVNAVSEMKQAIQKLIANPGSFDGTMMPLVQTLNTAVKDEQILKDVIEEIFTQSIREANFRYTGARICNFLSHSLTCQFPNGNFRQHLLKRCHEEYNKRNELVENCDKKSHLIGLTMFLGELLLNMTVGTNSDRIAVLAEATNELLSTLLTHPRDEFLKCVVQVLKLTGAYLELTEKANSADGSTPKVDKLFDDIKKCAVDEKTQRNIKAMLLSVVELRASNWGGMADKPTTPQTPTQNPQQIPMGPVYFNASGEQVSSPGDEFSGDSGEFEAWADPDSYRGYSGGYGGGREQFEDASDGGMDDEIAEAFDQFMIESESERASFFVQQPQQHQGGFQHYGGGHHQQYQQGDQQQHYSQQNQYYSNQGHHYGGGQGYQGRGSTYSQYHRINQHRSGQQQNNPNYNNQYRYNNGYQQ